MVKESTIGVVLKRKGLIKKRKRIRRIPQSYYSWEKLLPFEEAQLDAKEISDKQTLPQEIYQDYIRKPLPRWQWTFIEVND